MTGDNYLLPITYSIEAVIRVDRWIRWGGHIGGRPGDLTSSGEQAAPDRFCNFQ